MTQIVLQSQNASAKFFDFISVLTIDIKLTFNGLFILAFYKS